MSAQTRRPSVTTFQRRSRDRRGRTCPARRGLRNSQAVRTAWIGTPDDAVAKLRPLLEQTGAGGVLIWSKEWASTAATRRSYDLFTRYVLWFRRERARALFAVTMVAGLASTVFVPLTTLLVASLGWREALVVLALLLAVGTVPLHALVLRRRPSDLGLEPDGAVPPQDPPPGDPLPAADPEASVGTREALRSPGLWWLSAAFALSRLNFAVMGAHLVPMLLERGFTPAFVAAAVGAVGPTQLVGRLAFLPGSARWSLHRATVVMFACLTLAFLVLLFAPGTAGVGLFVTL